MPATALKIDADIHRDVMSELTWDPRVDETEVGVRVDQGIVTLAGTVGSWATRRAAEDAVRRVFGVLGVANHLAVRTLAGVTRIAGRSTLARSRASEGDIRRAIEGALARRAQREARRIDVDVAVDTVTVSGTVDTWREHEAVLACARYTPGVRDVVDRLRVDPYA